MPTLARLLLVFACLLLGPLVVMAAELPDDTDKITSLTVDEAKRLVETFPGVITEVEFQGTAVKCAGCLPLNGLKKITPDVAQALSGYSKGPLFLNGLTTLDADTAKALAEFKGQDLRLSRELVLSGLTTLDADTAKALAESKGPISLQANVQKSFFEKNPLTLETALLWVAVSNGQLTAITAFESPDSIAIAKALAMRKGPLALPNLKKISPKTLSALIEKEDIDIPFIETLELIREPDGSISEDFVIPAWLEDRQKQQRASQQAN